MEHGLKNIIIIGGGGHARVLRDTLDTCGGYNILGYTDLRPSPQMDVDYLGGDDAVARRYKPVEVYLANGIGSVRLPVLRQSVYERFKKDGFLFVTVTHPDAVVSGRAQLAEGVQVMAGAVVNTGAEIGENVVINTLSGVDHDCIIGAHTHIAPGVTLSGGVRIGPGSHVGTGAKIIQGVHIGAGALIGAGAVVIDHVPAGEKRVGVPGKGSA